MLKNAEKAKPTSFTLSRQMLKQLSDISDKTGISRSRIVRDALEAELEKYKRR